MIKPYAELKALRLEIKFSIGEMAAVMGVSKGTYQGYETGRRPMPSGFINRVRDWQQQDMEFMAGLPARIDAQLALEGFGFGIPSAIRREDLEL
ncbi:MAG: helix-turn-helix transcriptional regulator [Desulfuromonadales bacterium]